MPRSLPSDQRLVPFARAVFIPRRALLQPPAPWRNWTQMAIVEFLRERGIDAEEVVNWIRCRVIVAPHIVGLDTWKPPYAPEDGIWVYYRGEAQRGGSLLRH